MKPGKKDKADIGDIVQTIGDAFVVMDSEWRYTFVNDKALSMMQKNRDELLGKTVWECFPNTVGSIFDEKFRQVLSEGEMQQFETYYGAQDMWMEVRVYPHTGGISVFYTDISARTRAFKSAEDLARHLELKVRERTLELTEALEREKYLNEMKSKFVAIASHEFRTPLSTIQSSAELIRKYMDLGDKDKQLRHVDRIRNSVENLTNILNVFLSLEKLEQGKMSLEPEEFDFEAFLQNVVDGIEGMLKPGQHIVHKHKGEKLFLSDKKVLQNILLNLLSNAVKYSDKDILLETKNERSNLIISVQDQGIGIPPEEQVYLFSKFFRGSNANNIQGTGLGLNIVKRYVELLQGNIAVQSKQGEGTTFNLQLPVSPYVH